MFSSEYFPPSALCAAVTYALILPRFVKPPYIRFVFGNALLNIEEGLVIALDMVLCWSVFYIIFAFIFSSFQKLRENEQAEENSARSLSVFLFGFFAMIVIMLWLLNII